MKSNLTVGKNLVNADQHLFWKKEVSFIYNDFFFQKKMAYVAHRELLRVSDGLANQSFCPLDISRVQLKSNLAIGERLSASDQLAV